MMTDNFDLQLSESENDFEDFELKVSSSDESVLELKTCKKLKKKETGKNQKLFDDSSDEDSDFVCKEKYDSERRATRTDSQKRKKVRRERAWRIFKQKIDAKLSKKAKRHLSDLQPSTKGRSKKANLLRTKLKKLKLFRFLL